MIRECRRSPRLLMRYLDGELRLSQTLQLEEHLQSCAHCRQRLDEQRLLEEQLLQLPAPVWTDGDERRLLAGIHTRLAAPATRPERRPRRLLLLPLGAAAALVIGWGVHSLAGRRSAGTESPLPQPVARPIPVIESPGFSDTPVAASLPAEATTRLYAFEDQAALEQAREGRQQLIELLRSVPRGEPVAILRAEFLDPASAAARQRHLERLVVHENTEIAVRSMELLVDLLDCGRWQGPSPTLLPLLEQALRQKLRAAAGYEVLRRLPGERAWKARFLAAELPTIRDQAALDIAAHAPAAFVPARDRLLRRLLRSAEPADRTLLERCVAVLDHSQPALLSLLVELHREGYSTEALRTHVDALASPVCLVLRQSLAGNGPIDSGDALTLASLSRRSVWIPAFQELVRTGVQSDRALVALTVPRGPASYVALQELARAGEGAVTRSDLSLTLGQLFERDPDRQQHLHAAFATLLPEEREDFIELLGRLPGATGTGALFCLLECSSLDTALRQIVSVRLLDRRAGEDRDRLLRVLRLEQQRRDQHGPDDTLVLTTLLLSLYEIDGRPGLRHGLVALGLELDRRQEDALLRQARVITSQPDAASAARHMARMNELLHVSP